MRFSEAECGNPRTAEIILILNQFDPINSYNQLEEAAAALFASAISHNDKIFLKDLEEFIESVNENIEFPLLTMRTMLCGLKLQRPLFLLQCQI